MWRRVPILLAVAAAVGTASCAGDAPVERAAPARPVTAARPAPSPPAICGPLRATVLGHVAPPDATELSGLVLSVRQPGVLWVHNDSGDRARVFALRRDGSLIASIDVRGAQAVDWEDVALSRGRLYLGDIGDNAAARASVDVYRVPEPDVRGGAPPTTTAPAVHFALRYPDGAHDAETLLADANTGEIVIITKSVAGESGLYVARRPRPGATTTLRRVGRLALGIGGLATGGDVSADGRVVAVRTYGGIVAWARRHGATLAATLRGRPCTGRVSLGGEGQGEALGLTRDGRAFLTVTEGVGTAVRRYAPAVR